MPITPPRLDDRSFDDLVEELVARIPAHTPEWTHAHTGDPGRTLLDLFAWLGDSLLYRVNLIPERQRLVFLRLLGVRMRAASAATSLVSVRFDSDDPRAPLTLRPLATLNGPAPFETRSELTVFSIVAEGYVKRPLTAAERHKMASLLPGLSRVYQLDADAVPSFYATTPVFPGGAAEPHGFDLVGETADRCLWLALLAPVAGQAGEHRATEAPFNSIFSADPSGATRLLSVGVMPSMEVPALFEEIGKRGHIPHVWEITGPDNKDKEPVYHQLTVMSDSTQGLTRGGVVRLALPPAALIGAPSNDVRGAFRAGVGDRPPRLDDEARARRLVAWLRLRPTARLSRLALSWVGINAVEVDQRRTVSGLVVGESDGTADQELHLAATGIERASLEIEVEEPDLGYRPWRILDDLTLAGRDDAVVSLDEEAGTLLFGDGVRGRIPSVGMRVRVARMRAGGGSVGNLPPGTLKDISAFDLGGNPALGLKVMQSLPSIGGQDAETLAEAERRIPALLKHGHRAVTTDDFCRLAAETPGARVGRVEVLPRFKPHQRRSDVPGVVTVMVLPWASEARPPNPRPDRPFIEAVHAHLDARRPLATELYVIGCEYVPVGLGAGITVRDGFGRDAVVNEVREALYKYLWALPPGGIAGSGWPLGRSVREREIEVAIARVPGVEAIAGVSLFSAGMVKRLGPGMGPAGASGAARFEVTAPPRGDAAKETARAAWVRLLPPSASVPVELILRPWQLPELLAVVIDAQSSSGGGSGAVPSQLDGVPDPFGAEAGIPVPVVPEVC